MNISYYHASKFGNGAAVAEEFKRQMAERGISVSVCHVKRAEPKKLPPADLYVFSSPGRLGKPIGDMRKFLKKAILPPGAPYHRQSRPSSRPGFSRCSWMIKRGVRCHSGVS